MGSWKVLMLTPLFNMVVSLPSFVVVTTDSESSRVRALPSLLVNWYCVRTRLFTEQSMEEQEAKKTPTATMLNNFLPFQLIIL